MTDGSAVVLLVRMTVSLALVLGLLVWAARVVDRRRGGVAAAARRRVPVTVLARQQLGRRTGLSVVQVGEEILVLGVSDAEIRLLTSLDPATLPEPQDEPQTADDGEPVVGAAARTGSPSFTDALREATALALRRDVKSQGSGARRIADRLSEPPDRSGGRHRG